MSKCLCYSSGFVHTMYLFSFVLYNFVGFTDICWFYIHTFFCINPFVLPSFDFLKYIFLFLHFF